MYPYSTMYAKNEEWCKLNRGVYLLLYVSTWKHHTFVVSTSLLGTPITCQSTAVSGPFVALLLRLPGVLSDVAAVVAADFPLVMRL